MIKQITLEDAAKFFRATGCSLRVAGEYVRITKDSDTVLKKIEDGKFSLSDNDPEWLPLPAFLFSDYEI